MQYFGKHRLNRHKFVQVGLGIFGEPYLLIRTTWVNEKRFDSVEEDFALAEGEGSFE
jgi:uncharacterized protein YhfF